jgi:hypothetical protein
MDRRHEPSDPSLRIQPATSSANVSAYASVLLGLTGQRVSNVLKERSEQIAPSGPNAQIAQSEPNGLSVRNGPNAQSAPSGPNALSVRNARNGLNAQNGPNAAIGPNDLSAQTERVVIKVPRARV